MRSSKKAQMKIQQMAFMLVAVMIFFAMVAIVYFTITSSKLRDTADDLREEEAKELARQMAGTPELMFSKQASPYSSSVDFDKAFALSKMNVYKNKYWNLDYLMIEKVYPSSINEDCTSGNYPDCRYLILIDNTRGNYTGTQTAPVAIVWWDPKLESIGNYRFQLGRIHALAHDPTK
nr:hypothetical protein [uncultured archaeon]AQS28835.1 hypothetical protein [uncultured archaeon]AQS29022.1 hypothetical protein [uncultured archaeon]